MASASDDPRSRRQEYEKRLEEWVESARGGIERQAPEVLDKLASTARDLAQRLDQLANDARARRAEKEAAPAAGGTGGRTETAAPDPATPERPDEPPSAESGDPPPEKA
jgi:outer membrane murein-binding lipoprotein Lpp